VVGLQNADIGNTVQLSEVAIATTFWFPSGYNFGAWQLVTRCLILEVGFGVKLSDEDVAKIEGLRDVAMATAFGTTLGVNRAGQ